MGLLSSNKNQTASEGYADRQALPPHATGHHHGLNNQGLAGQGVAGQEYGNQGGQLPPGAGLHGQQAPMDPAYNQGNTHTHGMGKQGHHHMAEGAAAGAVAGEGIHHHEKHHGQHAGQTGHHTGHHGAGAAATGAAVGAGGVGAIEQAHIAQREAAEAHQRCVESRILQS